MVAGRRQRRGHVAHLAGLMAEEGVRGHYIAAGATPLASRWRGQSGEIDLIFRQDDELIFVEVKKAANHALAAQRLSVSQMHKICQTACEFCESLGHDSLTPMRFDVALVDSLGRIDVIANAFGSY
ncbi:MAG: YraN family protein [Paracoccus sp. (in: a-proteobacteria)]|nr:YraN family protein [Paracoccus sp. (in: a-proteobacteria)]